MTKEEARAALEALNLPAAQAKAAARTIGRATGSEEIEVVIMDGGDLLVRRSRPGRVGKQVLEDTIAPDGKKQVVQKAYDDAGNLTHLDPKGGTP